MGKANALAGDRLVAGAAEQLEDALGSRGAMPRPSSRTSITT